jgi:pimeloyl-ACP methyl ester carboxylesterase
MEGTVNSAPGLTLPEAIVVFVNGGRGSNYYDWSTPEHGPDSPFPIMSESIIIQELIPFVDSHFRTIPFRGGRAVEGFSMGGYGAVKFALEYPELFCSAVSYGGSGFDAHSKPSESIYNIVTANKSVLEAYDIRIRLVRGEDDDTPNDNQIVKDFLDAEGIVVAYETAVPNTVHDWGDYYLNDGDVGLDFHQDCFTDNPAPELNQFTYLPSVLKSP